MQIFREVVLGDLALRFYPSDNGWMCGITDEMMDALEKSQREPLTDEEIDAIYTGVRAVHHEIDSYVFARAIEAAHGIKE